MHDVFRTHDETICKETTPRLGIDTSGKHIMSMMPARFSPLTFPASYQHKRSIP